MIQTLLVTGGVDNNFVLQSSTEIYVYSSSAWSYAASLPSARKQSMSASLDNSVFLFGEY